MEMLFNLDTILFTFIEGSGFTILMVLGMLKVFAKETKWAGDDKIISMLSNMIKRD